VATAVKICFRNHHRITAAAEMGSIFKFFCKEVTGVDDARNVSDFCGPILMEFADVIFAEVEMFCAFVSAGSGPVDGGLVVVVDGGAFIGILHAEILCVESDALKVHCAFVCHDYFRFTGAESRLVLAD
jgi:hypothetical protein